MKDISPAVYEILTPRQRIAATLDAIAREDMDETARLVGTCPKKIYIQADAEYADGIDAILLAHMSAQCDIRQQIIYFLAAIIFESDKADVFLNNVRMMRQSWAELLKERGISPETMNKITDLQGLGLGCLEERMNKMLPKTY